MSRSSVNPSGRVYILERDEISAAGQQNWFVWRATPIRARGSPSFPDVQPIAIGSGPPSLGSAGGKWGHALGRHVLQIANAAEPAQNGRIYIKVVNASFLKAGGTPERFGDGIQRAVDKGWMVRHESGTYVKFTPSGAELFA